MSMKRKLRKAIKAAKRATARASDMADAVQDILDEMADREAQDLCPTCGGLQVAAPGESEEEPGDEPTDVEGAAPFST